MRETSFIKQNKDKWKEFEKDLNQENSDPDKMSDLFIQVTDDLSYSRTFYPNRSVRVYLNNVAQQVFYSIYKNRKTHVSRFGYFWTHELPYMVWEARKEFRLAFFVFALAIGIGALSCWMNPEFLTVVLGEDYMIETMENIRKGDPMAIYKDKDRLGMTTSITINNLWVAFQTFVMGALFVLGSFYYLLINGIMLGGFQFFFFQQDLFLESFLTIWIHGTIEISAIVIAGAAGITMGKGLVFPGTLTRMQSFQISARRGVKIMMGVIPMLILAGFFEGFLTRQTETPDWIRGLFILASLAFVLLYFWWLPSKRGREGLMIPPKEGRLPADSSQLIDFSRIKSSGEILSDMFIFYKKHFLQIGGVALTGAVAFCGAAFYFSSVSAESIVDFPQVLFGTTLSALPSFFVNDYIPGVFILNTFIFSCLTFVSYYFLVKNVEERESAEFEDLPKRSILDHVFNFLKVVLAIGLLNLTLQTQSWYTIILILPLLFPVMLLWVYVMFKERRGLISGLGRTVHLLRGAAGKLLETYFLTLAIGASFMLITDTLLIQIYIEFVSMNLSLEQETIDSFSIISLSFITLVVLYLIFPLIINGIGILYHSLLEIKDAPTLRKRVQNIGNAKVIQGMRREG